MKKISYKNKKGQVALTLLIFTIIASMIVSAAILILSANTTNTSQFQQSTIAYYAAETGIENAVLRLLRNPNYQGEELTIDPNSKAKVSITGSDIKTIISEGSAGNFTRKIETVINYTNNILTIVSWKEIQ